MIVDLDSFRFGRENGLLRIEAIAWSERRWRRRELMRLARQGEPSPLSRAGEGPGVRVDVRIIHSPDPESCMEVTP